MATSLKTFRFNETMPVHTGAAAAELRRRVRGEQYHALMSRDAAYRVLALALDADRNVLPALIAFCEADEAFRAIAETEGEVGRRLDHIAQEKDAA